jgi:hypothetical protein
VPSKSALPIAFAVLVLAQAGTALAQMIDDKMTPPVLLVPPPVEETVDDFLRQDAQDALEDEQTPLSIYEVPLINVPQQEGDSDGDKPMRIGTFSLLHKVTAKVTQINLPAGEEMSIGELTLLMQDCISAPPEEPPETRTFLQVSEFKLGTDRSLFKGWMFASSPSIHALEHPVYDLWPTACKTEDGLAYTGEILPPAPSVN